MHAPWTGWLAAGSAALLACALTAGCASHANPAAAPPDQQTSGAAQVSDSSSPAPAASPSASSSTAVQNLVVTTSLRHKLKAAYLAYMNLPSSSIAGNVPNSVYYAYDAATGTYWAMAGFLASSTASQSTEVDMQDGGRYGLFTRTPDGAWQGQRLGQPGICAEIKFFPAAVLTAWAISTTPPAGAC
jgi:hypothetical protein